ncbi:hypothetical protein EDD15DRAFT_2194360 [Pisolithus albus]|nr:hypothetical protein EDD15DRAFT_2194360 [Pisolithus albus]
MSSATDPESIINNYVEFIQPAFVAVITIAAFSASLFTLLVVLLALSTKESRRRLVFRLNVFAICITLAMGVMVGFGNGKIHKSGYSIEDICIPLLHQILFLKDYSRALTTGDSNPWFRNHYLFAEWAMQIADNMYSASFFLYNFHVRAGSLKRSGGMQARICQILYISAANFILPVMFSIALIILVLPTTNSQFNSIEVMFLINSYVTVMGVLCATVWFSGSEWVRTRNEPLLPGDMFALKQSLGRTWILSLGWIASDPRTDGRGELLYDLMSKPHY